MSEWDKLWEDKPDTLGDYIISDWGFEQWINRMERAGDKLIERVVYLEGLTDGDVKIITQLQVENEKLKHIIATGYCGECDVLKEENNQLREKQRETQFLLSCESDLYKDCKLDLGKYMKKLEAIRDVINDPPTYSIPFLGNPAPEVQDYIKRVDTWYCKLLNTAQNTEAKQT